MDFLKKTKQIALADLRSCYEKEGIFASRVNFSDFWARDTFWAMRGILAAGDFEMAKKCFELFLRYQKPDGDIPRKIALDWSAIKYVLKINLRRKKPYPIYKGNIPLSNSKDENALLVIAFERYLRSTEDQEFAREKYEQLKLAMKWYDKKMKSGFVREYLLSNWMDTIFKNGNVLYTNVLYCQALQSFSQIASALGEEKDAKDYGQKHESFKKELNDRFWNGEFYDDELGCHKIFDLAGNVLAVVFGVADQEKSQKIIKRADEVKSKFKEACLHPINYPKHPFWKITPAATVLGIINYQNCISWSWIEAMLIIAKIKAGEKEKARENLRDFSEIIIQNGHIHETYYLSGKPFDHLLWKSAVPFAWGAGLMLWATEELERYSEQ